MISPYAGRALPVRPDKPTTKWDLLTEAERHAIENVVSGCAECTRCGADVFTEGRFARHFTLPDLRYWNLGDCPNEEAS